MKRFSKQLKIQKSINLSSIEKFLGNLLQYLQTQKLEVR